MDENKRYKLEKRLQELWARIVKQRARTHSDPEARKHLGWNMRKIEAVVDELNRLKEAG